VAKANFSKAAAARLALEVRSEIGLDAHEPLDPLVLAEQYGIPIYCLGDLHLHGLSVEAIAHFSGSASARFSAALIPIGTRSCCIIENDGHAPTRRRTNLAHEMAHVIREHEFPSGAVLGPDGCRSVAAGVEEEADWLGGELLITSESALRLARQDATDEAVAERYGVSSRYAAMRMNASGVRKRVQRERQRRGQK
jgi:hypothetical protein